MKKLFAALIIVLLLLFSSCAPVGEAPEDYYLDDSWGSVFRTYWNAMNDNYVFWDLDSPSDEWDLIYDKYAPLFDSYGKTDQNTDEAFASLLEISRMLSDGHYSIEINLENGKTFSYYSYLSKLLENAGQEIKTDYFIYENEQPVLDYQSVPEVQQSEIFSENINNVLSFTFGISGNGNSISDEADGNLGRYFTDADAVSYEDGTSYPFTGILEVYPCSPESSIYYGNYISGKLSIFNGLYMIVDGNVSGYAITAAATGFGGPVSLMVGVTSEGIVYNTSVLSQSETPGLGAKCTEPAFADQFKNLNPAATKLAVKKDGGDIDAITASTITSRAYVAAVNNALAIYETIVSGADTAAAQTAGDTAAQTAEENK